MCPLTASGTSGFDVYISSRTAYTTEMNMQYRIDKTPVATKNRASLDTSADMPIGRLSVVLLHIFSPNRNGYSMLYTVALSAGPTLT